ncbi:hypothetical protein OCL06_03420 [Alteromonas sp. ASW11-19]|uniref:Cytochrome c n=1 Tax=Alteromonas salexigens TaxID=2982530 RepID=A0ABT2VNX5_9ALTE|nr:hypothetical protein [Alteromonas salexigens]MCU7553649.1 hypothetical protein [Alteromonas salexigens]
MTVVNQLSKLACTYLAVVVVTGCSNGLSSVRNVTYPPDFKYIERDQLRSGMDEMALHISILDGALQYSQADDPDAIREEVLTALTNIERVASSLQAASAGASHPFMEDHMRSFVATVDKARSAASLAEPRYYFAGKVAGACAACHKVNR